MTINCRFGYYFVAKIPFWGFFLFRTFYTDGILYECEVCDIASTFCHKFRNSHEEIKRSLIFKRFAVSRVFFSPSSSQSASFSRFADSAMLWKQFLFDSRLHVLPKCLKGILRLE